MRGAAAWGALLCALAHRPVAAAPHLGAGLGLLELRSTVGWYAARPLGELWVEAGEGWRLRASAAAALPGREGGEAWAYRQGWQRAALTLGRAGGTRALQVRVEAGPALSRVATTWSSPGAARIVQWAPGGRLGLGLELPLSEHWRLGGLAAATSRGRGLDLDLRVGLDRAW